MYRLVTCLLSGCVSFCQGCFGVCDNWADYTVTGQVLDASTSEPFQDAQISFDLLRDGESVEFLGRPTAVVTNTTGEFEATVTIDHNGGLCGGLFGDLPLPEFGAPPDEVRVIVRTSTGAGIAIVALDTQSVNESEYPFVKLVQLPTVEVLIVPG